MYGVKYIDLVSLCGLSQANHNTLWNSRKGAAFGFAHIATQAEQALKPHLPHLVPRLYRYLFDPTASVRAAMTNIWKTLAPEPTKTIDEFMAQIMAELLSNITSNQWRNREACCGAIADVLRGRRWNEVGEYLVELWQKCFRALDDVKESVRTAAQAACKRLGKLSVSLCSRDRGTMGAEAVHVILPCLIQDGQ